MAVASSVSNLPFSSRGTHFFEHGSSDVVKPYPITRLDFHPTRWPSPRWARRACPRFPASSDTCRSKTLRGLKEDAQQHTKTKTKKKNYDKTRAITTKQNWKESTVKTTRQYQSMQCTWHQTHSTTFNAQKVMTYAFKREYSRISQNTTML